MAQRTVLQSMSGAALSVSATLPATYDAAGYTGTALTFTEVGQIESFGAHGVSAQMPTFTAIKDAILQKFKGSKDYGTKSFVIGHLPSDAGQVILHAAKESVNRYSLKIAYPVGTGESTGEIHYLDVLVTKCEWADGDVNAIRKLNVDFAVCRTPVVVAAT